MADKRKKAPSARKKASTPALVLSLSEQVRVPVSPDDAQMLVAGEWVAVPGDMAWDMVASGAGLAASLAGEDPPAQAGEASHRWLATSISRLQTQLSAVASQELGQLRAVAAAVATPMDGRLQLAIFNQRSGKSGMQLASADEGEIPVIARVSSAQHWENLADVHPGAVLGESPSGGTLVTGRLPIDRIEAVRQDPSVLSLKASQPLMPAVDATVAALRTAPNALPANLLSHEGEGVTVGIVDFGCDFAHHNFIDAAGKTRILAVWHQGGVARADSPFGYGRLYERAEIDAALATDTPYKTLGYDPGAGSAGRPGMHGSHVMDIAAGNGRGTGLPGVAPNADIIFVEASAKDVHWDGQDSVLDSFGDSVQLLEAIKFIFDRAGDAPCVVNVSLGTNGGPHDGTSLVEQGIDALVAAAPNRAVVIAAGNAQTDSVHTQGTVGPNASLDVVWRMEAPGGGELELWYTGTGPLEATLIAPDGSELATVPPNGNAALHDAAQNTAVFVSSRTNEPNNGDSVIGAWIAPNMPTGDWILRLRSSNAASVDFHAWVERKDGAQSVFANPVASHLLGSISTGQLSVVVGSYDARKSARPISSFSSSGPTRDGRNKPELSAPGGNVRAARSRTGNGLTRKSGTSMAAPAVTGLTALMLAHARAGGKDLSIDEIRRRLLDSAAAHSPAGAWDPQFGAGKVDVSAIG